MSEREEACLLAERLLNEPGADPDDDLRTLARQLLRGKELEGFGVDAVADHLLCVTTVGYRYQNREGPVDRGNCFSVSIENKEVKVVNFNEENLNRLLKLGLTWPVRCRRLGRVAVVHDPRIGERWYDLRFCQVCCPRELLPLPQRLAIEREIAIGRRRETDWKSGRDVAIDTRIEAQFP